MGNHSIPVGDKNNITDEERTRLLNRAKMRKHREKHREQYREYQKEYQKKNKHTPAIMINRKTIMLRKAQARVAQLTQEIQDLRDQLNKEALHACTQQD